jgi:hypothetical protein
MTKTETVELLKQEYLKSQTKLHGISIDIQDATNSNTSLTACLPRIEKVIAGILDLDREANPTSFDMDVMEYLQGNHPLEELIKEWQKEEPKVKPKVEIAPKPLDNSDSLKNKYNKKYILGSEGFNTWTQEKQKLKKQILEELVKEEPTIPELGEGVLMEVSHDGENWFNQYIIAKYKEKYISNLLVSYTHARPIQPKKVTMQELEELVGGKFEIIK